MNLIKPKKNAEEKAFRNKKNKLDRWTFFDYLNAFVQVLLIFITLYPVWYVLCVSLSSTQAINAGLVSFWPVDINIDAYKEILETPKIPRAYFNSILYTGVGTVCCLIMTVMLAYPLSRKNFVFRKPVMIMIVITMFFSGGMIPGFLLVKSLGMLNTMWSLIIPNLIWTYDLIVMRSFFETIPNEIYEAAIVDGASEIKILVSIFIPLAKPAIASISLFYIMGQWNSFLMPSIYLTDAEKYPLQVVLRDMLVNMTGQNADNAEQMKFTPEALKNATIFVSVLPFLVVYPWLQKYFVKGLTIGAVKG